MREERLRLENGTSARYDAVKFFNNYPEIKRLISSRATPPVWILLANSFLSHCWKHQSLEGGLTRLG
jgi:hypothetical protein